MTADYKYLHSILSAVTVLLVLTAFSFGDIPAEKSWTVSASVNQTYFSGTMKNHWSPSPGLTLKSGIQNRRFRYELQLIIFNSRAEQDTLPDFMTFQPAMEVLICSGKNHPAAAVVGVGSGMALMHFTNISNDPDPLTEQEMTFHFRAGLTMEIASHWAVTVCFRRTLLMTRREIYHNQIGLGLEYRVREPKIIRNLLH